MIRNVLILTFFGLTVFSPLGLAATAQPETQPQIAPQSRDWSVRLGAMGMYRPEYEGSDDYDFQAFPAIDVKWRKSFFLNPRNGLGAYFYLREEIKLGAAIGYTFGRDQDDSSELHGLGDIDGGATGNLLFAWQVADLSVNARYEQQFTGEDTGFQVHAGLGYTLHLGDKTMVRPSLKTSYSSADYMKEYFSISPAQASRSGLPAYEADAGFKSIGLQFFSAYRIDRHWEVQALAGYDRMLGDAADSPLVKEANQYRLGVGFAYAF